MRQKDDPNGTFKQFKVLNVRVTYWKKVYHVNHEKRIELKFEYKPLTGGMVRMKGFTYVATCLPF